MMKNKGIMKELMASAGKRKSLKDGRARVAVAPDDTAAVAEFTRLLFGSSEYRLPWLKIENCAGHPRQLLEQLLPFDLIVLVTGELPTFDGVVLLLAAAEEGVPVLVYTGLYGEKDRTRKFLSHILGRAIPVYDEFDMDIIAGKIMEYIGEGADGFLKASAVMRKSRAVSLIRKTSEKALLITALAPGSKSKRAALAFEQVKLWLELAAMEEKNKPAVLLAGSSAVVLASYMARTAARKVRGFIGLPGSVTDSFIAWLWTRAGGNVMRIILKSLSEKDGPG